MHQYHEILREVQALGIFKGDRTGTGTQSRFGQHQRFSLRNNQLPVVTTKKIHLHSVIHELIWMISGDTRVDYLIRNGVRIWNEWVKPDTAVYERLTREELIKKIENRLGDDTLVVYSSGSTRPGYTEGYKFYEIADYLQGMDEDALKSFWAMYPDLTEVEIAQRKKVIDIDISAWAACIKGKWTPMPKDSEDDPTYQFSIILHRLLFKEEPRKLVGGDLGAVYGKTWRDIEDTRIVPKVDWVDYQNRGFEFVVDVPGVDHTTDRAVVTRRVDQLQDVIDQLQNNPDSRRIIICAWDPRLVEDQALPPCHSFIQFWTRELTTQERIDWMFDNEPGLYNSYTADVANSTSEDWMAEMKVPKRAITCQMYQRSVDTFLGLPFNIMFYGLMTHMLANQLNMVADEFIWTGGDTHIYSNHREQVDLQLTRDPLEAPTIRFTPESLGKDIRDIKPEDFEILNYASHAHIAGKVAV